MTTLRIDVWSDIACPWCYVGKRRLEGAVADFEHREDVEVVWRAFELDPSAPRAPRERETRTYGERLAKKYRTSVAQAEGMIARMTNVAALDGLEFRFDLIRPGNTFDAHRVLHLAREHGPRVQDIVHERFLRAYMTEGVAVSDPDELLRLATEAGLGAAEVKAVLDTDAQARAVRADEQEAANLGVTGVPFFVFDGRYGLSGAQPVEMLAMVLDRAWAEKGIRAERGARDVVEGDVCGPDGCRDTG